MVAPAAMPRLLATARREGGVATVPPGLRAVWRQRRRVSGNAADGGSVEASGAGGIGGDAGSSGRRRQRRLCPGPGTGWRTAAINLFLAMAATVGASASARRHQRQRPRVRRRRHRAATEPGGGHWHRRRRRQRRGIFRQRRCRRDGHCDVLGNGHQTCGRQWRHGPTMGNGGNGGNVGTGGTPGTGGVGGLLGLPGRTASSSALSDVQRVDLLPGRLVGLPRAEHSHAAA